MRREHVVIDDVFIQIQIIIIIITRRARVEVARTVARTDRIAVDGLSRELSRSRAHGGEIDRHVPSTARDANSGVDDYARETSEETLFRMRRRWNGVRVLYYYSMRR